MMLLAIGQPYPGWDGPKETGGQFEIGGGGGINYRLMFDRPTEMETIAFRGAPIQIGLVRATERLLFFMTEIPGCTDGWTDAPFSLGRMLPEHREIEKREPNRGWLIPGALVDSQSGIIHAMRAVTMTPAFSSVLDKLIEEQRATLASYSDETYHAEIEAAYVRWPRSADMIGDALITETAGKKFGQFMIT